VFCYHLGMEIIKIIAVVLFCSFILGFIALTIYGLVLGFTTSIVVGIIHLVITPLSFITGFTDFFFDVDLGIKLAEALGL